MEPVFTVVQEPPVPPQQQPPQLGQMTQAQVVWRCSLAVVIFLAVTGNFELAFAAYRARHSSRDLAFVLVTSFLLALLVCCVARLEHLRRREPRRVAERLWLRIAVWYVSVALAVTFSYCVAGAMPRQALKLVVSGVTEVLLGLGFYFLFLSKDAEPCGDGDLGRRQADAAGRRPAALLSPEV